MLTNRSPNTGMLINPALHFNVGVLDGLQYGKFPTPFDEMAYSNSTDPDQTVPKGVV